MLFKLTLQAPSRSDHDYTQARRKQYSLLGVGERLHPHSDAVKHTFSVSSCSNFYLLSYFSALLMMTLINSRLITRYKNVNKGDLMQRKGILFMIINRSPILPNSTG